MNTVNAPFPSTSTDGRAAPRRRMLYLSMQDPDLENNGTTVRVGAFVKNLARHYDLSLVHMAGAGHRVDPAIEARFADRDNRLGLIERVRVEFSKPGYFLFSPALYRAADRMLGAERFDVLIADYGLAGLYGRMLAARHSVPLVYSSHNVEYRLYWTQRFSDPRRGLLTPFVFWAERAACRASTLVVAISEADRQAYARWVPDERIELLPQGFDPEVFHPFYAAPPETPAVVLFVGSFRDGYNVQAGEAIVRQIAPAVARLRSDVIFRLVGAGAPAEWAGGNVEVSGFVDDIAPEYRRANLILAPMPYGAGMATKVVQGLAFGKTVLATEGGAGSIPRRFRQMVVAPVDRFPAEIVRLLSASNSVDSDDAAELRAEFGWPELMSRLQQRLEGVLPERPTIREGIHAR
jgi:glycosyltransferase involved in cell wall biosynthesis